MLEKLLYEQYATSLINKEFILTKIAYGFWAPSWICLRDGYSACLFKDTPKIFFFILFLCINKFNLKIIISNFVFL